MKDYYQLLNKCHLKKCKEEKEIMEKITDKRLNDISKPVSYTHLTLPTIYSV